MSQCKLPYGRDCAVGRCSRRNERWSVHITRDVYGPIFGRAHELNELENVRRDSRRYGRCCLVAGEPGIGKTRFVKQFIYDVPRGRTAIGMGRGIENVRSPFSVWTAALDGVAPEAVAALHPGVHSDKLAMYRAVRDTLRRMAQRRSIVLVLEDLHWADAASIELLRFLVDDIASLRRLLIVCTLRPTQAPQNLRALLTAGATSRVTLQPLDEQAGTALVSRLLPDAAPAHVARIVKLSAGNPFFAEELCKSPENEIPTSLQSAISGQVAQLSARDARVVECAALLGERFDLAFLSEVLLLPAATVAGRLEVAQRAGIVIEEREGAFRFAHALIQAVLVGQMTAARRIAVHERAARVLEASRRFDAAGFARLAYHYAGALARRKAYSYHVRAGDLAYQVHAYEDAANFYCEAAQAAESGSLDRARALHRQGDALFRSAQSVRAADVYRDAATIYRFAQAWDDAARLFGSLSRIVYNEGRTREALAIIEDALTSLPGICAEERDELLVQAALCAADLSPELGKNWLDRVTEDRIRGRPVCAAYYAIRSGIEATLGEVDAWRRTVERFEEHMRQAPATGQHVGHYGNIAAQALFLGLPATALYDRCLTIARTLHMSLFEAAYASHAAFERWLHGDVHGFSKFSRVARSVDAPIPALKAYLYIASLIEEPTFVPPLGAVYDIVSDGHVEFYGPLVGLCADRLAERGDLREARRLLDAAAEVVQLPYAAWETLAAMAQHGSKRARERAQSLVAPYRSHTACAFAASAAMVDALCAHHAGDGPRRDACAAQARTLYAEMGWVHHERRAATIGARAPLPSALSARESQISMLLREGRSNKAIAVELFISEKTVEKHLSRLFEKLHVSNRTAAVQALAEGPPPE